jgi:uncharacterized membrane protein YraQ (UPF0718 family)/regulator of protease activity HflC (stomatin/prohibitin superfamily)
MGEFGQLLAEWLAALWMVLAESGPYLLVGFVIAGILAICIPAQWIARRLGGDDVKSVGTAAIIGVPVPLCSCSVIPTATQLRRSGASKGATTSFLISTPETGVDSIGATWALMDPLMTVVRPVAAFMTAFAAGIAVNLFGLDKTGPLDDPNGPENDGPENDGAEESEAEEDHGCCAHMAAAAEPSVADDHGHSHDHHGHDHHGHDHGHSHDLPTEGNLLQRAFRYAFGTLLDDLTPWFLIGFAISGLIVVAVPDGFFSGNGLSGWTAMLTMLVAGVPLYVCATASTPIAAAMMAKGLEPGAALVFLLAGPATNVATMLVVKDLLGKRTLAIYLACIALMSLAIGTFVNRLYPMFGLDPTAMDVDPAMMEHGVISTVAGITLGVLLAYSAWRLRLDRRFGAWLRKVGAPIGFDPTALPVKIVAAALAIIGYASTAVSTAGPGETVFIEQFGRVAQSRTTPGPLFHAPWPIGRAVRVSTSEVHSLEFGVDNIDLSDDSTDAVALKAAREEVKRIKAESEMLTGEGWIVAVAYAIQYRIVDAERWTYGQAEPEEMIRRLSQESVRQVAARLTIEDILVDDEDSFRRSIKALVSAAMDKSGVGAELVSVELQSVHAPSEVHSKYRDVASALIEVETTRIEKEARRIETISEARIIATETVQKATIAKARALALTAATAEAFHSLADVDIESGGLVQQLMGFDAQKRAFTLFGNKKANRYFAASPFIEIRNRPFSVEKPDRGDIVGNPFNGGER